MEQLYPVSITCYERGAHGLRMMRSPGTLREGAVAVHLLHKNGNHYDLFREAPCVDTLLGPDMSGPVSEAVRSNSRPPPVPASAPAPEAKRR
eukprot:5713513-Pyramimonas_sp.AAC.1